MTTWRVCSSARAAAVTCGRVSNCAVTAAATSSSRASPMIALTFSAGVCGAEIDLQQRGHLHSHHHPTLRGATMPSRQPRQPHYQRVFAGTLDSPPTAFARCVTGPHIGGQHRRRSPCRPSCPPGLGTALVRAVDHPRPACQPDHPARAAHRARTPRRCRIHHQRRPGTRTPQLPGPARSRTEHPSPACVLRQHAVTAATPPRPKDAGQGMIILTASRIEVS